MPPDGDGGAEPWYNRSGRMPRTGPGRKGGGSVCGRYYIGETPDLAVLVEAMNRSPLMARLPRGAAAVSGGEVRPGNVAPVIATARNGSRAVFPMRWGFSGKTLLINAKSETAAVKPTFREAWAGHRCIVPASWYFEWEHRTAPDGKRTVGGKFRIGPGDAAVAWLCGLYRLEEGFPCYVILTREPGEGIRFIHDRMPLMLPEAEAQAWIRPDADPADLVRAAQTDMAFQRVG